MPACVLEFVVTLIVEFVPGDGTGFGEKEALALFGSPLALSLTEPLKPPSRVIVTV